MAVDIKNKNNIRDSPVQSTLGNNKTTPFNIGVLTNIIIH